MKARLVILGRGETADCLGELARHVGYETVMSGDDVPSDLAETDHVVVSGDEPRSARALLADVLRGNVAPAYLGYAAAEAETSSALAALVRQGILAERLAWVVAPAGVRVGAETGAERAISVAAQLVAVRRGVAMRDDSGMT